MGEALLGAGRAEVEVGRAGLAALMGWNTRSLGSCAVVRLCSLSPGVRNEPVLQVLKLWPRAKPH